MKKRMGDDFVILTERYSKLFRGLDVALHNRVHELDKPVIRFCEWDVAITLNRLNNLIGTVPVNQTESLATTQAIAAAHIKRNAQALIAQMTNFLTTCKQQSAKMQRIKLNSFVGKSVLRYLPAIMLVKKEDRGEVVETKLPSGLEQLIGQRSCTKIGIIIERTLMFGGKISFYTLFSRSRSFQLFILCILALCCLHVVRKLVICAIKACALRLIWAAAIACVVARDSV